MFPFACGTDIWGAISDSFGSLNHLSESSLHQSLAPKIAFGVRVPVQAMLSGAVLARWLEEGSPGAEELDDWVWGAAVLVCGLADRVFWRQRVVQGLVRSRVVSGVLLGWVGRSWVGLPSLGEGRRRDARRSGGRGFSFYTN